MHSWPPFSWPATIVRVKIQTMPAQPFVVPPQGRTQSLNVVGEHITVLASAAQTGSYEMFSRQDPKAAVPHPTTTRGTKRST